MVVLRDSSATKSFGADWTRLDRADGWLPEVQQDFEGPALSLQYRPAVATSDAAEDCLNWLVTVAGALPPELRNAQSSGNALVLLSHFQGDLPTQNLGIDLTARQVGSLAASGFECVFTFRDASQPDHRGCVTLSEEDLMPLGSDMQPDLTQASLRVRGPDRSSAVPGLSRSLDPDHLSATLGVTATRQSAPVSMWDGHSGVTRGNVGTWAYESNDDALACNPEAQLDRLLTNLDTKWDLLHRYIKERDLRAEVSVFISSSRPASRLHLDPPTLAKLARSHLHFRLAAHIGW